MGHDRQVRQAALLICVSLCWLYCDQLALRRPLIHWYQNSDIIRYVTIRREHVDVEDKLLVHICCSVCVSIHTAASGFCGCTAQFIQLETRMSARLISKAQWHCSAGWSSLTFLARVHVTSNEILFSAFIVLPLKTGQSNYPVLSHDLYCLETGFMDM